MHLPPNRLRALARYGAAARAQAIAQMAPERRLAPLLAFAHAFAVTALDDAVDLLDLVITEILHAAETEGQKERLRTLRDLDTAALHLWEALKASWTTRLMMRRYVSRPLSRCRVHGCWRRAPKWRHSPAPPTTIMIQNASSAISRSDAFCPPYSPRSRLRVPWLGNRS